MEKKKEIEKAVYQYTLQLVADDIKHKYLALRENTIHDVVKAVKHGKLLNNLIEWDQLSYDDQLDIVDFIDAYIKIFWEYIEQEAKKLL